MRRLIWTCIALFVGAMTASGRAAQAPADQGLNGFFAGAWSCAGAFSSGKSLEADMKFTPQAGGKWLLYQHEDRAPGVFKAAALWGQDRLTGRTISLMTDSGGGARMFASDGWQYGKIVFTIDTLLRPPSRPERFVFQKESADTFRMTWEVSADAVTWHMGDYLVCKKAPGA